MADKITVASALEPIGSELTDEQRRQRYADIRQRQGRSILEVTAPAGKTAYWARKEDTAELARLNYKGFEIVKEVNLSKPLWKANGRQPDGTYVIGDVILMEIDTELYDWLLQENREKSNNLVRGASEGFKGDAERAGVPTFDVSRKKG